MIIQAVDNLGLVMTNLLKTQTQLDEFKSKLSDLNSEEGNQWLDGWLENSTHTISTK